ncbi:MAG: acyltransferase family protein [Melioribacteraceae bacterium]|nr:acyltransferase family protein [Melioribacteraceae bacterium]
MYKDQNISFEKGVNVGIDADSKSDNIRLYYLDWLRVIVFGLLIVFHCLRLFDFIPFHIKNAEQSELLTQFFIFSTSWRMPLVFLVSGAGTYFAMRSKKGRFIAERVKRLIIPFLFGIILLIPPQKYFEYVFQTNNYINYISYLADYPKTIASSNIGFSLGWSGYIGHHIWYLVYLFIQTIILIPFFKWVNKLSDDSLNTNGYKLMALLFIPMIAINIALRPYFSSYLDWADFFHFMVFFILGFVLVKFRHHLTNSIKQLWKPILVIAVITSLIQHYLALFTDNMVKWYMTPNYNLDYLGFVALRSINSLSWVLLIYIAAVKYFSRNSTLLPKLNEAVLPIYLIHQTIIIIIGFYVIDWSLSIELKFMIIFSLSCLSMYILYQPIKQIGLLRWIFGMKPKKI